MLRAQVIIAFLLGVVAALGAALVLTTTQPGFPQAHAQTSGNNDMLALMGNGNQGQSKDNIFIVDSKALRLAVYSYNNGNLNLACVRNIQYDLKFQEFPGKSNPSVAQVREKILAEEEKEAAGGKGKK
jgi:hypothetical protein